MRTATFLAALASAVTTVSSLADAALTYPGPFQASGLLTDVPTIHTMDAVEALMDSYNRTLRIEEVDGQLVFVEASSVAHVGTLGGEAFDNITARLPPSDRVMPTNLDFLEETSAEGGIAARSRCSNVNCLESRTCRGNECT
ncbi:hypothetical protein F5Y15DRAFT_414636 [Xylariaceae sp. FL0016]|nr:hypothetical protein F5Y15DRAFT_414636 [Xylariaceae sp. FL0016]